jgi:hypothetical protein
VSVSGGYPFIIDYLPLSYSGNSRGNWRILQGCQLETPGVAITAPRSAAAGEHYSLASATMFGCPCTAALHLRYTNSTGPDQSLETCFYSLSPLRLVQPGRYSQSYQRASTLHTTRMLQNVALKHFRAGFTCSPGRARRASATRGCSWWRVDGLAGERASVSLSSPSTYMPYLAGSAMLCTHPPCELRTLYLRRV